MSLAGGDLGGIHPDQGPWASSLPLGSSVSLMANHPVSSLPPPPTFTLHSIHASRVHTSHTHNHAYTQIYTHAHTNTHTRTNIQIHKPKHILVHTQMHIPHLHTNPYKHTNTQTQQGNNVTNPIIFWRIVGMKVQGQKLD